MRRIVLVVLVLGLVAGACTLPPTTPGTAGFPDGVAAGDVTDTSAVFWIRTAAVASVHLEIFDNVGLTGTPVKTADAATTSATDFTVKVTVTGLTPETIYYYRWKNGAETSQEGRVATAPAPDHAASFRFVVAADSDGYPLGGPPAFNNFEVLNAARGEQPSFFAYLGDTIYSDSSAAPAPATSLDDYRGAYAQNRTFANLRNLMAATGTFADADDHEVYNDYDGQTVIPARYANGWQAFREWMPTDDSRTLTDPTCAGNPRYFHQKWGTQAEIFQLDERSCRSSQDPVKAACTTGTTLDLAPTAPSVLRTAAGLPASPPTGCLTAINDPSRTMLGPVQLARFESDLAASTAKWKIVLSEVAIQQFWALPYDRWEGYGGERTQLLSYIRDHVGANVVFLTTDLHANIANEVAIDSQSAPTPIAYEAISGPIATNTYKQEIINSVGASFVAPLQGALSFAGVDCRAIDTYSYQLVEIDAVHGTMTVSSKDKNGNVVSDDLSPSTKCTKVFGP
jgi:phosphodiesterase/alkaline phosphatase D-like protein